MANQLWLGNAKATPQVDELTPGSVSVGSTFTVEINNKQITYTATAATVADVTAGLTALLTASTEGEFSEITWADAATKITATGPDDGATISITTSAGGAGSPTFTKATTTTPTGPNHVDDPDNWSEGSVPTNSDVIYIQDTDQSLKYGLTTLSAVTAPVHVLKSFTGQIGLPRINTDGNAYTEYRQTWLKTAAVIITIGRGDGGGSGRIKIDSGTTDNVVLTVHDTGTSAEADLPAVLFTGDDLAAGVKIHANAGSVGIAPLGTSQAKIADLNVDAAEVTVGVGGEVTNCRVSGPGKVNILGKLTTLLKIEGEGECVYSGSNNLTTALILAGRFANNSSGTVTTLTIGSGATVDYGDNENSPTVTDAAGMHRGASLFDPAAHVTFSNGIELDGCRISDVSLDLGIGRTLTPS